MPKLKQEMRVLAQSREGAIKQIRSMETFTRDRINIKPKKTATEYLVTWEEVPKKQWRKIK